MRAEGIALVTGASRGIGRAIAIALAQRGFDVIATMRDVEDGKTLADEAAEGRLRVQQLDVLQPDTMSLPDGLRVLVNNAGIEGPYLPVEHQAPETWRDLFATNVFGLVEVTKRAIPKLRAAGGGVICNVTSCSILVPMPLFAAYRASKAAVSALGESLRAEVADFGIRVVEIQPGAIETDMLKGSEREPEAMQHTAYRELAERVHSSRQGVGDQVTSAADAAHAVVEAILDDDGPLRHACDPMSAGLLAAWRATDDEEMMRGMLDLFAGTRSDR